MHGQNAAQHGRQRRHGAQRPVQVAIDACAHSWAEAVTHGGKRHQRRRARTQALDDAGRIEHLKRRGRRAQRGTGQIGQRATQGHWPAAIAIGQGADQHLAHPDGKDEQGDAGLQRADRLAETIGHGGQGRQVDVDAHRRERDQSHQETDQPALASGR
ncbi:hypothetical protein G6F22_019325 [Rhizopus arrhizus]|nr:hypothetical protein G6F22_019325 [Rhizopus arrhizus]